MTSNCTVVHDFVKKCLELRGAIYTCILEPFNSRLLHLLKILGTRAGQALSYLAVWLSPPLRTGFVLPCCMALFSAQDRLCPALLYGSLLHPGQALPYLAVWLSPPLRTEFALPCCMALFSAQDRLYTALNYGSLRCLGLLLPCW